MDTRGTANRIANQAGPSGTQVDEAAMMRVVRALVEAQQQQSAAQQQQNTLLRETLIATQKASAAAQETATAAIERVTAPREPRTGNVTDFMRMNPVMFSGTETPMVAEQWITDMENLLKAAKVPEADWVEVINIRLTDVARSWWLAEEASLTPPITWKNFRDGFFERFFPSTARLEMKEQFVKLKQWNNSVDEYAANFLRLSRFAPALVATEEDKAERFQQGLHWDIQGKIV
jgi:uncharacterized protein GlcG (DUF336 family)